MSESLLILQYYCHLSAKPNHDEINWDTQTYSEGLLSSEVGKQLLCVCF